MPNPSFTQNISGAIHTGSGTVVIGTSIQQISPHNRAARIACANAGLKSAEDFIQKLSQLQSHTQRQNPLVGKVLNGLEQVMNILGPASEYDPEAKMAVETFMSVLKLELERRGNDETIVTSPQTAMMNALRPLAVAHSDNAEMKESLAEYWQDIKEVITAFGEFAELYYNKCEWFASENIISRLDMPSSDAEKKAKEFLIKHQRDHVLENPKELAELGKCLKDPITSTTISAIREPLDQLLEENRRRFNFQLRGAAQRTFEYMDRATERILTKMDEGPHDLIEDAEVKEIWKGGNWKFSIDSRAFIDDCEAIGEAIDDDSSGFVSVHEINNFLKANAFLNANKEKAISTPVWIAFWAVGMRYLDDLYTGLIQDTIVELRMHCRKLRNRNQTLDQCLNDYADSLDLVEYITEWTDGKGLEDLDQSTAARLKDVADNLSSEKEEQITKSLDTLNYQVDQQSLPTILAGEVEGQAPMEVRIEHHIMVLLCLILRKQHETLTGPGADDWDDDQFAAELEAMDGTLWELILAFHERFKALQRSWRSQRLDITLQIQSFAGGLFSSWYTRSQEPNSKIVSIVQAWEDEAGQYIGDEDPDDPDASIAESPTTGDMDAKIEHINKRLDKFESMLNQLLSLSAHQPTAAQHPFSTGAQQDQDGQDNEGQDNEGQDNEGQGNPGQGNTDEGPYDSD
ncbi:hypothetical protein C8F01DRAFT_1302777 [Mycena amicta]|nr:hypothetical protein C8F01DRAFT_1302777 [Mycena amicta]